MYKLELTRWSKYLHTVYHANFSYINLIYPKKINFTYYIYK